MPEGSKQLKQAWVGLISQAQEFWRDLAFAPLCCFNQWPSLPKVGQSIPVAMDCGESLSQSVWCEFDGENGFTPEIYWQRADIIVLFSECCKFLWRQNCLSHPWREINLKWESKIIEASLLILSWGWFSVLCTKVDVHCFHFSLYLIEINCPWKKKTHP